MRTLNNFEIFILAFKSKISYNNLVSRRRERMEKVHVSVIIPAHNEEGVIKNLVESLIKKEIHYLYSVKKFGYIV